MTLGALPRLRGGGAHEHPRNLPRWRRRCLSGSVRAGGPSVRATSLTPTPPQAPQENPDKSTRSRGGAVEGRSVGPSVCHPRPRRPLPRAPRVPSSNRTALLRGAAGGPTSPAPNRRPRHSPGGGGESKRLGRERPWGCPFFFPPPNLFPRARPLQLRGELENTFAKAYDNS